VLDNPDQYRDLGVDAAEMIRSKYSLDVCLPQMLQLYADAAAARAG
jgi:hypothetical protein